MSRRAAIIRERKKAGIDTPKSLGPAIYSNTLAPHPGALANIVPRLVSQGAKIDYRIGLDKASKTVCLTARCGAIQVPLVMTAMQARALIEGLLGALDAMAMPDTGDRKNEQTDNGGE